MSLARISTELAINLQEVSAIKQRSNGMASVLLEGTWLDADIPFEVLLEAHNNENEKQPFVRTADELVS